MAEFGEDGPQRGPRRPRAGGQARPTSTPRCRRCAGCPPSRAGDRAGRPPSRRICAGFPKGRSDMAPLVDHRMLDRHRSRDRPRRTGGRPQRRRHGATGRGRRRPRRRVRRPRASPSRSTSPTAGRSPRRCAAADDAFGGIDVLVNNAGYGYLSAVEEGEDAEVRKLFDTNYFGVVDTIKAVLPAMRARAVGPHRQHLVDDRPGGQPAQRVLLVDEVRARGADRGVGAGGASRWASR